MSTKQSENLSKQSQFFKKFGKKGHRISQRIRRCFMTGKQCIFSVPQIVDNDVDKELGTEAQERDKKLSVFVIMPFQPNLDTFYEWSLKRYLRDGLGIEDADVQIRRADEFRDIGYVMCEKICRRIQGADLIVVDLSIKNPNVMYEMGIAVGLYKPLLVLCNQENLHDLDDRFLRSIGLRDEQEGFRIIEYPGVGYLEPETNNPVHAAGRVRLMPRKEEMKIVPLLIADNSSQVADRHNDEDIPVKFSEALRGAVGVAMTEIAETKARLQSLGEALRILGDDGIKKLGKLTEKDEIVIVDKDSKPMQFKEVAKSVDSAFTCLLDLAGENPHSYFWLGYCHARGINAIPISRDFFSDGGTEKHGLNHSIAFDIRALWYIRFEPDKVRELSLALRAALEELITKDIPKQQRNIFWERLTRHPRIHIYTGAVHHEILNREVVGDWDQRTVSELVRYLSSGEESVVPELERPIYSPGTIKDKLKQKQDWVSNRSLTSYIDLIKRELEDKNCIIVASADVNALTEVVLAHAYGVEDACFKDPKKHKIPQNKRRKIVVALKGWKKNKDKKNKGMNEEYKKSEVTMISTFFSRSGREENLDKGKRGFLVNDNKVPIQKSYKSQDDVSPTDKGFSLLSHLLVMQNPFWKKNRDAIIVLLDGVSGPGTFGLAEVLTGGRSSEKAIVSERLLGEFNSKWAPREADNDCRFGIEGIMEVKIQPQKRWPEDRSEVEEMEDVGKIEGAKNLKDSKRAVRDKFHDLREVVEWDFYRNQELMEDNPRDFQML